MVSVRARASVPLAWAALAGPVAVVAGLSAMLWPQWRHNPDLSHGFFMPFICALLVWQSRSAGPVRYLSAGGPTAAGIAAASLAGLLVFFAGGLFATSLGWSHAVVGFSLTAAGALFLFAGLLYHASETERNVPFNWISLCAVGLWLLVAPIPPGTYTILTLKLQTWVTRHVLMALHLLGVAARRRGNLIELARATVGVEEACSGIRSLLSCVFAGFFFAACLVRRPVRRAVVIIAAPLLAVAMNFLRSLALTLLANAGVDIAGSWHAATGFAILAVTAALLAGLALLLETPPVAGPAPPPALPSRTGSFVAGRIALFGGLGGALALTVLFATHTRPAAPAHPPPSLAEMLPAAASGWDVRTSDDLYRFSGTLQTEQLFERTYTSVHAGRPLQVVIYLAYWAPGQAPVSLVASHTPDACWPGTGWELAPADPARTEPEVDGHPLPAGEYRLFRSGDYTQHVWFWHLYNGRVINHADPYSPRELLRLAWRYGFGSQGDQLFIRISSNRPWAEFAGASFMRELASRLRPLGLR